MTIDARFKEFHDANPGVYELFERLVMQGIAMGKTRISAKFIFELMRWSGKLQLNGTTTLNNNFTSRYVREFSARHPTHSGVFETRTIKP